MISEESKLLVSSLQNPSCYDQADSDIEDVKVLQTHMSWIFLVGEHAYKVKKPLDLGFADFSTLEKRLHYCHEELRVNRRVAPHLYLNVVPITGSCESPVVDGPGEPCEYAVQMRRFPQENLLPQVLQRGELTTRHMTRLAHDVASFHERVEVSGAGDHFGRPTAVWEPMHTTLATLQQNLRDSSIQAALDRLEQWSEEEYQIRLQELTDRKRDGFVRECHGDMHLRNMLLEQDSITLFDGIEFSADLRWIDVINEIAFLVMDFQRRGCPMFANRFLNDYLQHTQDYRGLRLLSFYSVYRALVRAKVRSIRLTQDKLARDVREELQREIRAYLDAARHFTQRPTPRLWITHGLSGSGKTTVTDVLVDEEGMIRIRSDVVRKKLFGDDRHDDAESRIDRGVYSPEATGQTYDRLLHLAEEVVRAGRSVIVDATFLERSQRGSFRQAARALEVPFRILDFRVTPDTARRRISARRAQQKDASDADLRVFSHQQRVQQPLGPEELSDVARIDTEHHAPREAAARLCG